LNVYSGLYPTVCKRSKTQRTPGKNLEKFKILARTLLAGEQLDSIHRDHKLIGSYVGRRDCHIESDWILIYKIDANRLIFERMGTHADLFKK
jgi:mRNA interferase YafQ